MNNLSQFSDSELYSICKKWGREALAARRRFAGLLPEVYRREMELREGDAESAGMNMARAGISAVTDEQNTGMNMGSASQGVGQTVVSLFEPDVLNNPSLSVLTAEAGSSTTAREGSVPVNDPALAEGYRFGCADTKTHGLQLDTDVEKELMELQEKGIDVSDFLRKCLEERRLEIAREKEELAEEANRDREDKFLIGKPASRHNKARICKIIVKEHGKKCSAAGCTKPATHIHHQKPFATFGSHDPRHLRPLCKAHHELAHEGERAHMGVREECENGLRGTMRRGIFKSFYQTGQYPTLTRQSATTQ